MKVTRINPIPEPKPFGSLWIQLETQEELDGLFNILHVDQSDSLKKWVAKYPDCEDAVNSIWHPLWQRLKEEGGRRGG